MISILQATSEFAEDHGVSDPDIIVDLSALLNRRLEVNIESRISAGSYATAFLLDNGQVLKVTADLQDVAACSLIKGKKIPQVCKVHQAALTPFRTHYEELEVLGEVQLGIIITDFVPHKINKCLGDHMVSRLTNLVDRIIDMNEVRPNDLRHISAKSAIERMRYAQEEIIRVFRADYQEFVKPMEALHERGIYTCDVHSGNWRCDDSGKPVLIDLGVGKMEKYDLETWRNPTSKNPAPRWPQVPLVEHVEIPSLE